MDFANDELLTKNAFLDYNEAAPNFNKELQNYTTEYNKLSQGIDQLNSAIDQLPALQDKKNRIDLHINTAVALKDIIKGPR